MSRSQTNIMIRDAVAGDRAFILGLSPQLAEVAKLTWHTNDTIRNFQDDYIIEMLDQSTGPHTTLIAEDNGVPLGFVHACEFKDAISQELCGTVPFAVTPTAQGRGVGRLLMIAAEDWSKTQGHRLLHLEVFANNTQAQKLYETLDFEPETLVMIKTLSWLSDIYPFLDKLLVTGGQFKVATR
jgi:GNAT superfamily N-acetyltransferase